MRNRDKGVGKIKDDQIKFCLLLLGNLELVQDDTSNDFLYVSVRLLSFLTSSFSLRATMLKKIFCSNKEG